MSNDIDIRFMEIANHMTDLERAIAGLKSGLANLLTSDSRDPWILVQEHELTVTGNLETTYDAMPTELGEFDTEADRIILKFDYDQILFTESCPPEWHDAMQAVHSEIVEHFQTN